MQKQGSYPDGEGNSQVLRTIIKKLKQTDCPVAIAQLLLERIASPPVVAVESLPETIRGAHRFGSSGLNTLSECADISSAAAADMSLENENV